MPMERRVGDELVAELELVIGRLEEFRDRATDAPLDVRARFEEQVSALSTRAEELSDRIRSWVEGRTGSAAEVDDLTNAVDALEADLAAVEAGDRMSYRTRLDRQLRTWRARVDHLRLQESLGQMELRDELDAAGSRLGAARSRALVELRGTSADAKDVVIDLRDDVEDLLRDVRRVIERAADALRGSSS